MTSQMFSLSPFVCLHRKIESSSQKTIFKMFRFHKVKYSQKKSGFRIILTFEQRNCRVYWWRICAQEHVIVIRYVAIIIHKRVSLWKCCRFKNGLLAEFFPSQPARIHNGTQVVTHVQQRNSGSHLALKYGCADWTTYICGKQKRNTSQTNMSITCWEQRWEKILKLTK